MHVFFISRFVDKSLPLIWWKRRPLHHRQKNQSFSVVTSSALTPFVLRWTFFWPRPEYFFCSSFPSLANTTKMHFESISIHVFFGFTILILVARMKNSCVARKENNNILFLSFFHFICRCSLIEWHVWVVKASRSINARQLSKRL